MAGYVPRKLRDRSASGSTVRSGNRRGGTTVSDRPKSTGTKRGTATKTKPAPRRPSPRPSPGSRPAPTRLGRTRPRRTGKDLKRLGRRMAIAALAVVVVAGAAFGFWFTQDKVNSNGVDARTETVSRAAKAAASALFSYDYRDFDASIKNGSAHVVGAFADEYKTTTEGLRDTAVEEEAQVTAEVVDIAVITESTDFTDKDGTSYDDAVEVLAFLNQTTKNANVKGPKIDTSRVALTMVETDDGWKAASADAF